MAKKRQITPHKGGRTERLGGRVTPAVKGKWVAISEVAGLSYPDILSDERLIKAAQKIFETEQKMLKVEHANGEDASNTFGQEFSEEQLTEAIDYLVRHNDLSYTGGNDWAGTIEFPDGTLFLVNFDGSTEEL